MAFKSVLAWRPGNHDQRSGRRKKLDPQAFEQVAIELNKVALEIADIDAVVTDCKDQALSLSEDFVELAQAAESTQATNQTILATVAQSRAIANQTNQVAAEAEGSFNSANREIGDLITTVAQITSQLQSLQTALTSVRSISTTISAIARRTDLLALNAAVEAARAGDAGKGFAVVAGEVKRLASQTSTATSEINATLNSLNDESLALIKLGAEASSRIATVQNSTDTLGSAVKTLAIGMNQVQEASATISSGSNEIDRACAGFVATVQAMRDTIFENSEVLGRSADRMYQVLRGSDDLVGLCATSGFETGDTALIDMALRNAAELQEAFADEILAGTLRVDDLFDHDYDLIPDSNPEQYLTRSTLAIERIVQPRIERLAEAEPRIVFCAVIDVNGYMPVNLLKYSRPQGPDPVWNKANSRNRWIFKDRTGQACGKNTRPFLLQTYRRDMGGGQFVLMKDASAPIHVAGRHWGGFRIAYRPI